MIQGLTQSTQTQTKSLYSLWQMKISREEGSQSSGKKCLHQVKYIRS